MAKKINPKNARKEMVSQFKRKFQEPATHMLEQGLRTHVNNILDTSKPMVPIQTGALLESGKTQTQIKKNFAEAAVGYGNSSIITKNAPQGIVFYAVRVHELHHSKSKYLENAVNIEKANETEVIFKKLKDYLK